MEKEEKIGTLVTLLALVILVFAEFFAHRVTPFMMDDLWYGTNLVTGAPLRTFQDIVESMVWHFYNWGGRCMTHGVLQITLMSGELCADIINVAATLLLTFLCCVIIRQKRMQMFLLVHSMIFALNANVKMSMLWQAGTANYVYSTGWMLLFLWPYLRALQEQEKKPLPLSGLWLVPAGLLAGWSNENMGAACFLAAAGIAIYCLKVRKKRWPSRWMLSGIISSLLGSVLVVAAPGNFVRSAILGKQSFLDRFLAMLKAGTDFLLPAVLPMTLLLLVQCICLGKKLTETQCVLLVTAVLSYGAMVLSPHYPDRATFGTMVMCIAVTVSALDKVTEERPGLKPWTVIVSACFWVCAVGRLLLEISYVQ